MKRIVLSGVEGINKGAELMLYAILQEIQSHFGETEVIIPVSRMPKGISGIKSDLILHQTPNPLVHFFAKRHITGILNRLGIRLQYLNNLRPIKNTDYFLDASGLFFSDQTHISRQAASDWNTVLAGYHHQGTKIIFLPQSFGPFNEPNTQTAMDAVDNYSDLIIARDSESLAFINGYIHNKQKVRLYRDFTSTVDGYCPAKYKHLAGGVCFIPNTQMINKGIVSANEYISFIAKMMTTAKESHHEVFLLDHSDDLPLIHKCQDAVRFPVEIVSGLNALEVKGIISESYACFSSRFHGVASSFNTGVPCVTTSWNHKYQEILKDYQMEDCLLPIGRDNDCIGALSMILIPETNEAKRMTLASRKSIMLDDTRKMWDEIWK